MHVNIRPLVPVVRVHRLLKLTALYKLTLFILLGFRLFQPSLFLDIINPKIMTPESFH